MRLLAVCLRRIPSFIARYFSASSSTSLYSSSEILQSSVAFEMCECTVLSFEEARIRTDSCFAALAEHLRLTATPAASSRPATPVIASNANPGTNPTPEANRPAPTAPVATQDKPSTAHVPCRVLTALRYFFMKAASLFNFGAEESLELADFLQSKCLRCRYLNGRGQFRIYRCTGYLHCLTNSSPSDIRR